MRLQIQGLKQHLNQNLSPIYLLSGDEPLQMREAADQIRAAAQQAGFTQRERLTVENHFHWHDLINEAASMSLFADKKIIDLFIPNGKPGAEGSKVLTQYAAQPSPDNLLIIHLPKLETSQKNSKWLKSIDQVGVVIQIWPIEGGQLIQWLKHRLESKGLSPEPSLLPLLAEHVEGNLLAAQQEIDKLQLLYGEGKLTTEQMLEAVSDSARFDVFKLVDSALEGKTQRSLRILQGLQNEGIEPPIILWALAREIRSLFQIAHSTTQGQSLQQAINSRRDIWEKRKPLVMQGVRRLQPKQWQHLLELCQLTDKTIKGQASGSPWLLLQVITSNLSGIKTSIPSS